MMHEVTQRRLLQVGFVALCIVPTLSVLLWSIWIHTPWHVAGIQRVLQRRLGMRVAIGQVTHPGRFQTKLAALRLLDPVAETILAEIESVRATRTASGYILQLGRVDCRAADLRRLARLLSQHLLCRPELPVALLDIHIQGGLVLRGDGLSLTFSDIAGRLQRTPGQLKLTVDFRTDRGGSGQLIVMRTGCWQQPEIRCTLETAGNPLPLGAIAPRLQSLLGPDATFEGLIDVDLSPTAAGPRGRLRGSISGVELERLAQRLPHDIAGTATLSSCQVRFANRRIEQLQCRVDSSHGRIGNSLLLAGAKYLSLDRTGLTSQLPPDGVDYQDLSFFVDVSAAGLTLKGLDPTRPHAIVSNRSGALLLSRDRHRTTVFHLAQALTLDGEGDGGDSPATPPRQMRTELAERILHAFPLAHALVRRPSVGSGRQQ